MENLDLKKQRERKNGKKTYFCAFFSYGKNHLYWYRQKPDYMPNLKKMKCNTFMSNFIS